VLTGYALRGSAPEVTRNKRSHIGDERPARRQCQKLADRFTTAVMAIAAPFAASDSRLALRAQSAGAVRKPAPPSGSEGACGKRSGSASSSAAIAATKVRGIPPLQRLEIELRN
jgi:hypothetical protein